MTPTTPDATKAKVQQPNPQWEAKDDRERGYTPIFVYQASGNTVEATQESNYFLMSPAQARQLAHNLMAAASTVEGANDEQA